jgi:hypothetical protein
VNFFLSTKLLFLSGENQMIIRQSPNIIREKIFTAKSFFCIVRRAISVSPTRIFLEKRAGLEIVKRV